MTLVQRSDAFEGDSAREEPDPDHTQDGPAKPVERSYLQIFKSSATIAGSSLVTLFFSIIRNTG